MSTFIGPNARVTGNALVTGNADIAHGTLLGYAWTACCDRSHGITLRYGCEYLPLSEWYERLPELCRTHDPARAEKFETALWLLLDLVSVSVRAYTEPA